MESTQIYIKHWADLMSSAHQRAGTYVQMKCFLLGVRLTLAASLRGIYDAEYSALTLPSMRTHARRTVKSGVVGKINNTLSALTFQISICPSSTTIHGRERVCGLRRRRRLRHLDLEIR